MKQFSFISLLSIIALVLVACPETSTPNPSKTYTLNEVNDSGVSGTAKFEKLSATETKVTLDLTGTTAGTDHLAHIHVGDIPDAGAIYIDLTNVSGATGKSETTVSKTNANVAITYEQLIDFDGYVNVHESLTTFPPVAQGESGKDSPYSVYTATLSGANEVPPVTTTATGSVTAKLKGNTLTVKGTYEGLSTPAAAAHIHGPAAAGTNAGVVFALVVTEDATTPGTGTITTSTTTLTLTDAQKGELEDGLYYVNIHTPTNGSGEIRGQLE